VRSVCETSKQAVNLSVHQDGWRLSIGIPEILDTEAGITEINVMPSRTNIQNQLLYSTSI
jgi:hypothetical protein